MAAVTRRPAASLVRIETIDYRLPARLSTKRKRQWPAASQSVAGGLSRCRHILSVAGEVVSWTRQIALNSKSRARRIRPWTLILDGNLFSALHVCDMLTRDRSSMSRLKR